MSELISLSDKHIDIICSRLKIAKTQSDAVNAVNEKIHQQLREDLKKVKIKKSKLVEFADTIESKFYSSLVQAGEMVGIVAATSIGEPTTQQSVIGSTNVLLKIGSKDAHIETVETGAFIDRMLELNGHDVTHTETLDVLNISCKYDHDSESYNLSNANIYIMTVDRNTEKCCWKPVSQISRHINKDKLMTITTFSGKSVTTTLYHSYLVRTPTGISPEYGANLKIGDRVPVLKTLVNKSVYYYDLFGTLKRQDGVLGDMFWDKIISIEYYKNYDSYVYDFGVEGNHTFMVSNGIFVHNTLTYFIRQVLVEKM